MEVGYHCKRCGEWHSELPLGYGTDAPDLFYALSEEDREEVERNDDICIIETTDYNAYFIAGNLEIPIHGSEDVFTWTVWVSLSEPNMQATLARWETPGRENDPPCFGWLSTSLPGYPDTLNLKTLVHMRPVGQRPLIELEPTDNPLAVEQRIGITWDRIQEIAETVLHGK